MPVYNCQDYIFESVQSVLNQSFKYFELIIIDDCSTDKTVEIISQFNDPRILLVRKEKNTGLTNSLNYGLSISRGKYIARMDGDDISHLDRLKLQFEFMELNRDVVLCGTGYKVINTDFEFIPLLTHAENVLRMIDNCPFAHPTIMMRYQNLKDFNIQYDPNYEPAEDYKLWIELSKIGQMVNLPKSLLYYRIHENQTTNKRSIQQIKISNQIIFEHLNNLTSNLEYAIFYVNGVLNNISDFRKYKLVEAEIKKYFDLNNIKYSDNIFVNRDKRYFRSIISKSNFSPSFLYGRIGLLVRIHKIIGFWFLIKIIVKSLIYWRREQKLKKV